MRPIVADLAWSMCLLASTVVGDKPTAAMEVPFGVATRVGLRKHSLDGVPNPPREEAVWGTDTSRPIVKYRRIMSKAFR